MKIPFLKPGTFKDYRTGKSVSFSENDLDKIISSTKLREYQDDSFPIVISTQDPHPLKNAPAFGWIKKDKILKEFSEVTKSNILAALAEDSNLSPDLKNWIQSKHFKNVSASLYKDYAVNHIALLGASPPAIKGLPEISFSDDEELITIELSEYEMPKWYFRGLAKVLRGIKSVVAELKDAAYAETLIPEDTINELSEPPRIFEVTPNEVKQFSENLTGEEMDKLLELQNKFNELEQKYNSTVTDLNAAKSKLSAAELEKIRNTALSFCESDEVKLKIKPTEKNPVVEVLVALEQNQPVEFSEGTEKKTVKPVDLFKEMLKRLPDVVTLGEFAHKGRAGDDKLSDEVNLGHKMAEMVNKDKNIKQ